MTKNKLAIIGGSGNNFGAILGGFAVWFLWIEAAPIALFLINCISYFYMEFFFL